MTMEGAPAMPDKKEQEPITDEQCVEAMKSNNFELVQKWYAEQERKSEADPTIAEHLNLIIRFARLQNEAGLPETALETLEAAYMDAYQQHDDLSAAQIDAVIKEIRKQLA